MAQPNGQALLDSGKPNYAATSFWYCDGSGLWDAKAGASLSKTGAAGVATEGGAKVVLGDGATYYALPSSKTLSGQFTIMFKARTATDGNTASMICGSRNDQQNFVWLAGTGAKLTVRGSNTNVQLSNSSSSTMATYAIVRGSDNYISLYKNGAFVETSPQILASSVLITHILSGYTGTSFILNGALEFLHIIEGVSLNAGQVASYYSDPYQDIATGTAEQTITTPLVDSVTTVYQPVVATTGWPQSVVAPLVESIGQVYAPAVSVSGSGSISLTSPLPYKTRQRDLETNSASMPVSGTFTGSPATIEYRFAGGAWTTLVASPSGGTFSTNVLLPVGQGSFEVRFSNDTAVTASSAYVTVGDVFIVAGQSNHAGRAPNKVDPVFTTYHVPKLGRDGVWKQLTESTTVTGSFDEGTSAAGSYIGALSNRLQSVGVPVAFIPVAQGSTTISQWARYDPDPTNPYYLYGKARQADIAAGGHRAVLWLLGESDALNGQAQSAHEAALNALVNNWNTDTGGKFFVIQIVRWQASIYGQIDAIRAAQAAVAASNANVAGIADGNVWQSANNVHYQTVAHIDALADVVSAGMLSSFYLPRAQVLLTTDGATPAAGLSGIRWAWWDAAPPDLSLAPVDSGVAAATDANGLFSVGLQNTSLSSGNTGTLLVVISDGVAGSAANKAFCAPVEVT